MHSFNTHWVSTGPQTRIHRLRYTLVEETNTVNGYILTLYVNAIMRGTISYKLNKAHHIYRVIKDSPRPPKKEGEEN